MVFAPSFCVSGEMGRQTGGVFVLLTCSSPRHCSYTCSKEIDAHESFAGFSYVD